MFPFFLTLKLHFLLWHLTKTKHVPSVLHVAGKRNNMNICTMLHHTIPCCIQITIVSHFLKVKKTAASSSAAESEPVGPKLFLEKQFRLRLHYSQAEMVFFSSFNCIFHLIFYLISDKFFKIIYFITLIFSAYN